MNGYYQNGPAVVAAQSTDSDNHAGFGALRLMQDMYQQRNDHLQSREQHTQHLSRTWLHHPSQHRNYSGQSSSQDASYGEYREHAMMGREHAMLDREHAMMDRDPYQVDSSYEYNASGSSRHNQHHQHHQHHQHSRSQQTRHEHHYHQQHQHQQQQQRRYYSHRSNTNTEAPASSSASSVRKGAASSKKVLRSDTIESSTSDSTAGLAYNRSGDSQFSPAGSSDASRGAPIPSIKVADRTTIYEDDYEEPFHAVTTDTMPRPASPASATWRDVSTDVSFTIARATVLEPDLPKAKCADCGEKLDFEELANHTCQPADTTRPPLLTIQVPSSSTPSSTSTSPALTTPRSPFFDRYDTLVNDAGPLSPALFGTVTLTTKPKAIDEDDETPKAHAVRIVGTQAAIKVTHVKASTQADGPTPHPPRIPSPLTSPVIQRSASDAASARRKMIVRQREAKRKETMASPIPKAATMSSLSEQARSKAVGGSEKRPSRGASGSSAVTKRAHAPYASESQHAKTASSSSLSSTSTNSSERMGLSSKHPSQSRAGASGSYTTNITPSSSYERIEEGVMKTSTDSGLFKQTRGRGGVDLSGIEEMMKGLTEIPEPLERTLMEVSQRRPSQTRETKTEATSSQGPSKTDRELELELELERLRDKERTRQLQAQRLKDKRKKGRAAKRCCICDCSLSSSRTPFVERDGKFLCARDWKELYLPKCRKCNLSVEKGAVKSSDGALRGVFHRSCFSCAACEAPFADGSFYVYNNQPYCSRHYHRLNGSLCRECESGIEGDCRQTDTGDRFHPQCFSCQYTSKKGACLEPLADYYVVGGQRLCERHAARVGRRLAKAGQKLPDLRAQKRITMLHSLR